MVAFQMFHHQVPFEGMSPVDAARAAAYERRRPIISPHVHKDLAAAINQGWSPNPNSRPTFEALIGRLDKLEALFPAVAETGCCSLQ